MNTRLHAAAVPLEQRIEVKAALVRAGWLPRAEAPGTVHAGQGDMRMPRQVVQLLQRAKLAPPPAGKALKLAHVDTQLAAAEPHHAGADGRKDALRSAGQIES